MRTEQATLILASLLRSPRTFQSFDLSPAARLKVIAVQQALEEFETQINGGDPTRALEKLNGAYRLLGPDAPTAVAGDLSNRRHPVLAAADQPDRAGEAEAWRLLLSEAVGR